MILTRLYSDFLDIALLFFGGMLFKFDRSLLEGTAIPCSSLYFRCEVQI